MMRGKQNLRVKSSVCQPFLLQKQTEKELEKEKKKEN